MPTRRAKRPDGRYYRESRRQRLSSGGYTDRGGILSPTALAGFVFLILAGGAFYFRHAGHYGLGTALLAYGSLVLFFLAMGATLLARR